MPAPLFSWLFVCFAFVGVGIQITTIYLMRAKGFSFWMVLPFVLMAQYLFVTAYSKAPNFIVQWFLTSALSGMFAVLFGVLVFGDKAGWPQYVGVFLTVSGLFLMMSK